MQWYYIINGEQQGPVDSYKIRYLIDSGTLNPDDYIWNNTMGREWKKISAIPELTGNIPAPPLPSTEESAAVTPATPVRQAYSAGAISCTAPVGMAWQRMKDILFRPFNMSKWFALAVSAWLASLGNGGSSSLTNNAGGIADKNDIGNYSFQEIISYIEDFWYNYNHIIITGGIVLIILGTIIGLLVAWLRSRGKFMLLDNVIHNTSDISAPWHEFRQHANSLFLWQIFFSIFNLLVFGILGGIAFIAILIPCFQAETFVPSIIPSAVTLAIISILIFIFIYYIRRFVEDFIIPIMYNMDMTVTEAWREFGKIFSAHRGAFIIYGLFYLVLSFLSGAAVLIFIIMTCCIGFCLLAIPFIGTVVMLPIYVFFRAYSLEYLAQFGPEYICFEDEKEKRINDI